MTTNPDDFVFTSELLATKNKVCAEDLDVVAAAQVSTKGEATLEEYYDTDGSPMTPERMNGLINFLMKNRHGCYDSETEVLTSDGWKAWPDVDGSERFLTLDLATETIEYQSAERVVHKAISGPMIRLRMEQVDMLVTPGHRMVAAPRRQLGLDSPYELLPAEQMLERGHRLRMGGGAWSGSIHAPELGALIGFIVADANVNNGSITFHITKRRKLDWLHARATSVRSKNVYRLAPVDDELRRLAKATYNADGDRCFPRELLNHADVETLSAMLDGYLEGDGSVDPSTGKVTCSTVSDQLAGEIQELALKCGRVAVHRNTDYKRVGAYGERPVHKLTVYGEMKIRPKLGWTALARAEQVTVEHYEGDVHCVTVPNGTLYVRRNGKPMWCGNTPFEHNYFRFFVSAPIAVFREFHRHRIGWSYNEESGRYKQLAPKFYIPPPERPLMQVGKPGHYTYVPATPEHYAEEVASLREDCTAMYQSYERSLERGTAKEVARGRLPVYIYSSMWASCNARSIMSFLSLRSTTNGYVDFFGEHFDPPEDPLFRSYPMWEIEQVALRMEAAFAEAMPLTHRAFRAAGSASP